MSHCLGFPTVVPFKPREIIIGEVCRLVDLILCLYLRSRKKTKITLLRDVTSSPYSLYPSHCRPGSEHTSPRRAFGTAMVYTAPPTDMGDSRSFNYEAYSSRNASVKVEPASFDLAHRLLRSPIPSSPRSSSAVRYPASSSRCKRKSSYSSTRGGLSIMTSPYGESSWSSSGLKNAQTPGQRGYSGAMHPTGSSRRTGSGDQQPYGYSDYSQVRVLSHCAVPRSLTHRQHEQYREDARHTPTNPVIATSSLSGAVGDLTMSQSPSAASPSGMAWTPSPTSGLSGGYAIVSDDGNLAPYLATPNTPLHIESSHSAYVSYPPYNSSYSTSEPSSQHPSGMPSPTGYSDHFAYQQSRSNFMMHPRPVISPPLSSPLNPPMAVSPPPDSISISRFSRPSSQEDDVRALKNRIRELELINDSARQRVKELEHEVARGGHSNIHASSSSGGLPSPAASPVTSTSFQEGWRSRTEARKKLFCSLNRAGNALCAWHDSRRERRAYPPRMAPPGHLNCGCTYEEALFEESLARHGVGSYHPGENVRMDPALRKPLLKLLQDRYGYRDGDFERDPTTGEWFEGEGPAKWEARAAAGNAAAKKRSGDERS